MFIGAIANHVRSISILPYIIARLANLSFTEDVFPDSYKSAIVTPILKKLNLYRDDPANYRPISNLNNISKLLERLFCHVSSHMCLLLTTLALFSLHIGCLLYTSDAADE